MNGANSRKSCCACLVLVCQDGFAPPMFLTCRVYSAGPSLLGILAHNWHSQKDSNLHCRVRSAMVYPLAYGSSRPIFVSFTCGNRKHTRHCTVHDAALGLVPCFRTAWCSTWDSNPDSPD